MAWRRDSRGGIVGIILVCLTQCFNRWRPPPPTLTHICLSHKRTRVRHAHQNKQTHSHRRGKWASVQAKMDGVCVCVFVCQNGLVVDLEGWRFPDFLCARVFPWRLVVCVWSHFGFLQFHSLWTKVCRCSTLNWDCVCNLGCLCGMNSNHLRNGGVVHVLAYGVSAGPHARIWIPVKELVSHRPE